MREVWAKYVLNGLSVVFGVYILFTLWHRFESSKPQIPVAVRPGKYLAGTIFASKWPDDEITTVLFLSTSCHYCDASMPFYKQIITHATGHTHVVAVFPQMVNEAKQHLANFGVPIEDVRQLDFSKFGITGTPTLVIARRDSKVDTTRIGLLNADQQKDVLVRLGITAPVTTTELKTLTGKALAQMINQSHPTVIDVRERSDFKMGHISGAIDMPIEEIEARGYHELEPGQSVVLYCKYCGPCERARQEMGEQSLCTGSSQLLRKLAGVKDTFVVTDEITQLTKDHVPVESTGP